uniref:Uncharacterized protein n=1 Tax=Alexandrium catenella TaxID=2925 RepID=A0A7S1LMK9_ALECA|mmetsp:Transcript_116739/g.310597  ORF Transcript_116739/g.310597 Transcript_116739/m.310597 type:complete len:316 (+) Transcript_116739:96-1043(+)|eukprot:CAMPEP_0171213248 /NCGR_PEP_ID=MMETSP0790-20130122/30545_1 /TAXON_ID=2925 /ORGANISM="Alexandrium catenella, Strain OF101" /LENGTH=315 /DNA_ID=CAMNT_0011678947 /DNA_START=91 /DNA_END=1038 /DNA_ORIENTATION=+
MPHPQRLFALAFLLAWHTAGALLVQSSADHDESPLVDTSCANSVSFLFLARDGLPLQQVWRKFLDGCEPGGFTVHIHSQQGNSTPAALPEAQLVADPVEGELRRNYTMQLAMHRLYRDASRTVAPNGCRPRWAQMLSDSCAPLRSCADLQAILSSNSGSSLIESWLCTVGAKADACYSRKPGYWRRPWYKAHQWNTLWMDHARMLLAREEENFKNWHGHQVPDEHYAINILDSLGANHTAFGLTHVYPFLTGRKAHPEDIDCPKDPAQNPPGRGHVAFSSSVQDVVTAGRVFARKFGAECVDSLLANLPDATKPR